VQQDELWISWIPSLAVSDIQLTDSVLYLTNFVPATGV
jgi:hypothetical protein